MAKTEMLPLFKDYTIDDLHERTGYSEAYLVDIKQHPEKARPQFRRMVTKLLNRPLAELFGPEQEV